MSPANKIPSQPASGDPETADAQAHHASHAFNANREGFALVAAILAMVLIGAVVTGAFYTAGQESAVANASVTSEEALMLAEQGISDVMGAWGAPAFQTLANSQTAVGPTDGPSNGVMMYTSRGVAAGADTLGKYDVKMQRLGPVGTHLFLLTSQGTAYRLGRRNGATRTISQLVHTIALTFPTDRAIMSMGALHINDNQLVVGTDYVPTGWSGCTNTGTRTGAVSKVAIDTNNGTVTGSPATAIDPAITAANFNSFGGVSWSQLTSVADKIYAAGATVSSVAPVAAGSVCTTSVISNWGDPTHPTGACYNYMPVIYAQGNLSIAASGAGQGILLVEGNLAGAGNFQFYGVVIVHGSLAPTQSTLNVYGTLLTQGGGSMASTSFGGGDTKVQLSTCAVQRAMSSLPQFDRIFPVAQRSWVDLSSTGMSF